MSKTIDERAKAAWEMYIYQDVPTHRLYNSVYEDGYKQGAIDQQQELLAKACEWLKRHNDMSELTSMVSIAEFMRAMINDLQV